MKFIITETKTINITAEVEAPNAAAAMMKYKKDSSTYSIDYAEQSEVEVNEKLEFLNSADIHYEVEGEEE